MCQQLTILGRNQYQQTILICEHDTLHVNCQNATILMSRGVFYELDMLLQSRCLPDGEAALQCRAGADGMIELWLGRGAFRLQPAEMIALAKLVHGIAARLRRVPLADLLQDNREADFRRPPPQILPSAN